MAPNKTVVIKENSTTTYHLSDLHRLFSKRFYGAYNVSILYYDDGYANRFWLNNLHGKEHAWDRELRRSDIIVVGIGAWFKPGFHPVLNNTDYYEDMRLISIHRCGGCGIHFSDIFLTRRSFGGQTPM